MIRRRVITSEEQDVHTGWRHVYCWQRGQLRKAKRRTSKRERREGSREIAEQMERSG